jgi:hypothetical protein
MRKRLEEIYCERVRDAGSHGTWEPPTRVWPGTIGEFRRGVFSRTGDLDKRKYGYKVVRREPSTELIETSAISSADASAKGAIHDPLGYVLSGKGELSYSVAGGDEVLLLTQPGRWYEIEDVQALLAKVQASIEDFPLGWAIVCRAYETSGAVIGVSSRSTSEFTIGLTGGGSLSIAALARAGGRLRRGVAHAARRSFSMSPAPDGASGSGQRSTRGYTPLFNKGYRVRRDWFPGFGRPELVTFDGKLASFRIATSDPTDMLYDASRAQVDLAEIKQTPLDDLFEEATPELISDEVSSETEAQLFDEEIEEDLTPDMLLQRGVGRLKSVSVTSDYADALIEFRQLRNS